MVSMIQVGRLGLPLIPYQPKMLYITFLLSICMSVRADDGTLSVTIDQASGFPLQRDCGKGCLQNNWDNGVAAMDVRRKFNCASNACYCGTSISTLMESFMSSCWIYCCNAPVTTDVVTAMSIYDGYCATAYAQQVVAVTTTSMATTPGISTALPASTSTISTSTTSPTPQPVPGISKGAIGGIVGGVLIVAIIAAALLAFFCIRRKKKSSEAKSEYGHSHQAPLDGRYEKAELPATVSATSPNPATDWNGNNNQVRSRTDVPSKANYGVTALSTTSGSEVVTELNGSTIQNPSELEWNPYAAELEGHSVRR